MVFLICRTKYQKNVEASHNKGLKTVPNSIRSENYTITFEIEEEKYELNLCVYIHLKRSVILRDHMPNGAGFLSLERSTNSNLQVK